LPGDLQSYVVYGASMLSGATQPVAAQAFVIFLRSPAAASVFKKAGMLPV
jgi:ABC-type molybdate transport system substrate-binding protein